MITSTLRGHKIEYVNGVWIYSDTKEPTAKTHESRSCGLCNEMPTSEGHDGCLGTLPNVKNACCGHGEVEEAYIQFEDGSIVRGLAANRIMESESE